MDKKCKTITAIKYDEIGAVSEDLWETKQADKWGFLDSTGKEVIPFIYDKIGAFDFEDGSFNGFNDGLAMVKLNGKWGVIDKAGKEVIPLQYESFSNANNYDEPNKFIARLNDEWYYFDDKCKLVKTTKATIKLTTKPATTRDTLTAVLLPPVPMKGTVDASRIFQVLPLRLHLLIITFGGLMLMPWKYMWNLQKQKPV